jgi:hypothetical protein
MSVQTVERTAASRLRTILGTGTHPVVEPSLRAELFLIAHEDETGRPHIDPAKLELALAVAILLELWLDNRILIGWRFSARHGTYQADPGLITICDTTATGDPLKDAALVMLWYTNAPRVRDFIRDFAATGLYERVRGDMIATGLLRRTTRRRFFRRIDSYTAVHDNHPVRARTKVRNLATSEPGGYPGQDGPYPYSVALAALVTRVGLARYLASENVTWFQQRLDAIAQSIPTIREVISAFGRSR